MRGTPQNFREAAKDAVLEVSQTSSGLEAVKAVERVIGDYLAQKFTAATINASIKPLNSDELIVLYEEIVGEDFIKSRRF